MPVYEFYCPRCHTVFSFFSPTVETEKRPRCPGCGRPGLERQVSIFAVSRGRAEPDGDEELPPGFDESKMMQAMQMLESEAGTMDEDDPRQAAKMMRKLYDATGLEVGPGMEEAMRRMEAGEDPDQIEAELGDVLENEDPFQFRSAVRRAGQKDRPPLQDDTLYDLREY